jgi:septal ring factor EnvC (AmiA/AmiB activator)
LIYRLFILSALCCGLSLSSAYAETQQQKIQNEISKASSSLNKAKAYSSSLEKELSKNQAEINRLSRKEYETEQSISRITQQLIESNKKKQDLSVRIKDEKEALAKQLLAMYSSGEESHLRLLLKEDDPSDISRTTKYFEYLNRSRVKRIERVRQTLKEAEALEASITQDRQALNQLRISLAQDKKQLSAELRKNEIALGRAKSEVVDKSKELAKLKKQEAALQAVFEKLVREQQAKARQGAARVAASKAAAAKSQASSAAAQPKQVVAAKPAPKPTPPADLKFVANRPFSSLRGRLPWPVQGTLYKKYGSKRNEKQTWKGVLIKAPGGQRVHAVARGKVEYAGPLRGYGYVVILQHDNSYRTLYAYNRAVYRKTGDIVKGGDVIGAVGNSGEHSENALYFEIRKGATTKNPSRWCK